MSFRDRFDDLTTWLDGALEASTSYRERDEMSHKFIRQLNDVLDPPNSMLTGFADQKVQLVQVLLQAGEGDLAALADRLSSPLPGSHGLAPDEQKLLSGYRGLNERSKGALLGAIESMVSKSAPESAVRGRHNFWGSVNHVADNISNFYINGQKMEGSS